ncbi:hypothetical protein CRUP_024797 [Coryphaenoides rupestris]|nr:hypothetical protein CRUP_024797 [Coryphaenoides rupestris]
MLYSRQPVRSQEGGTAGITGIRFAKHQRCYIKTQSTRVPSVAQVAPEDTEEAPYYDYYTITTTTITTTTTTTTTTK